MLKVEKNNLYELEILMEVLNEEMPESDSAFQYWLEENADNRDLYLELKGEKKIKNLPFNKEEIFSNISDLAGLKKNSKNSLYRKKIFKYSASFLAVISLGLTGYFFFDKGIVTEQEDMVTIKKDIFIPGGKKAYILSNEGETLDLSEAFELNKNDGTVISNNSKGLVSFKHNEQTPGKVKYHTMYVPKRGEYALLLSDGSKVFLNSETTLTFPEYFDGETRKVELTGEAYFEIKKDSRPFIVQTTSMRIEVLGTSFNLNAYEDNELVHATLVEGSVKVYVPENPAAYLLKPENNFSIHKNTNEITIRKVNTDIYTAWVKGEFVFRNQPLNDILTQLQRWYDFEIAYEDPVIKNMRFTGSAEKTRPLDYLLNLLQTITDVKYREEGEKIILYK